MWIQFFVSLINFQLFFAYLGNYSSSKHSIAQELGVTDTFFGTHLFSSGLIDMLSLLSRCLFTIYLILFPFSKLKLTNFVLALLQFVALGIIALSHFIPSWYKFLMVVGMILLGAGKGNISLIYLVGFENMRGNENPSVINLWSSLTLVGDGIGLLLSLLFLYSLGWNWSASMMVYNGLYLLSSLSFYFILDEVEVNTENRQASQVMVHLKEYYSRQTSNWLLLADFVFLSNLAMVQLFWLPYYFA